MATGTTRDFSGQCTCEQNIDYEGPSISSTPNCYKGSLEDCCKQCGATPGCVLSVWAPQSNDCELKLQALKQVPAPNKTACHAAIAEAPLSVPARVPGDLVTDLQRAGIIGDPLFGVNFKNASKWAGARWEYTKSFPHPFAGTSEASEVLLVFDGIKMGATISLNGQFLGNATNQFVRYTFPVGSLLKDGADNVLSVVFHHEIRTEGRYMQCSGGVDWGPYSDMRDPDGHPIFTKGIWKSVALVAVPRTGGVAIQYLVPKVHYAGGDWPTAPLRDFQAPFTVNLRLHLWSPLGSNGTLSVNGSWGAAETLAVTLSAGSSTIDVRLPADRVQLWWPRGHGAQSLYEVGVTYVPEGHPELAVRTTRRVGFRLAALVTVNDSDAATVAEALAQNLEGNGEDQLMMRVNGAPVALRGANAIPMENMEGRYAKGQNRALVASAAAANMNMLRVWGGGIYPFDEFLDACDEMGILVFQDMQYMTVGIMPGATQTPNQEAEIRHQVRRLSHHPSVVIWSGCNECGGSGSGAMPGPVYSNFVLGTVAQEDDSRILRNGCPFLGYASGVHRLTGFPNGRPLTEGRPITPSYACAFRTDVDISSDSIATFPCSDQYQCCARCQADDRCAASVQYEGTCYLKAAASQSYTHEGRIACLARNYTKASKPAPPWGPATEFHGPYQHGGMFKAVNGGTDAPFTPPVVVAVQPGAPTGPSQPGYMVSETGCVVMSSFESMSATLAPEDWSLHAEPMRQRNYPCDPIIYSYFGLGYNLNETGEAPFKKHLYLCMLGQALQRKAVAESWRSANLWMLLQWQLNEIWPTGGWGSLEYGTPMAGQVLGGRWKPLHYFFQRSSYTDVVASCGTAHLTTGDGLDDHASGPALCYLRNDLPKPFVGRVQVSLLHFLTGASTLVADAEATLPAGAGSLGFLCAAGGSAVTVGAPACPDFTEVFRRGNCVNGTDCIMTVNVTWASGAVASSNVLPLAAPKTFKLPTAVVTATVAEESDRVFVDVVSDAVALYVWLSTTAQGRFSDNAMLLLPHTPVRVEFLSTLPGAAVEASELRKSLRVEHLGQHLAPSGRVRAAPSGEVLPAWPLAVSPVIKAMVAVAAAGLALALCRSPRFGARVRRWGRARARPPQEPLVRAG